MRSGQYRAAWEAIAQAIALAPDEKNYRVLFLQAVSGANFGFFSQSIKGAIAACLADDELMHRPLFWAWASTLLHDPEMSAFAALQPATAYDQLRNLMPSGKLAFLNDPFLTGGLKKCLIQKAEFEQTLTYLRRYFLLSASSAQKKAALPFLTALASQCFFNEYAFIVTEEEVAKVEALRGGASTPSDVALLACYVSLEKTPTAGLLSKMDDPLIKYLQRTQVEEPKAEVLLKSSIPSFGNISDEVSNAVRQQYEENPFPRWIGFGDASGAGEDRASSKGRTILIAGCGTGQQVAGAATNFPLADITAIDLSRASLAYAARKAKEYCFDNVKFAQGDLLQVAALNKTFDYIICGGVLHHMQSPRDGLAALKAVLKARGVMRIALYSEIARKGIVAVQNWIKQQGYPATAEGIRAFRAEIADKAPRGLIEEASPLPGFHTLSECRDTYFHVQEHRFTFLTLKAMLDGLDLEVIGLAQLRSTVRQTYLQAFPEDEHCIDLENWHVFEQDNPKTFIGMYKVYVGLKGVHAVRTLPPWLAS